MHTTKRRDWFWAAVFAAVFVIIGLAVLAWLGGCQSSTKIEGGKSEAKAVSTSSRARISVTEPSAAPQPVPAVRVRVTVKESAPCN